LPSTIAQDGGRFKELRAPRSIHGTPARYVQAMVEAAPARVKDRLPLHEDADRYDVAAKAARPF